MATGRVFIPYHSDLWLKSSHRCTWSAVRSAACGLSLAQLKKWHDNVEEDKVQQSCIAYVILEEIAEQERQEREARRPSPKAAAGERGN